MFEDREEEIKKLSAKDRLRLTNQAVSRDIVQKIKEFGVNQAQIRHIIFLLSLELESNEDMKKITSIIKNKNFDKNEEKKLITDI